MKHYFIVNPVAGTRRGESLAAQIAESYTAAGADFEIHRTLSSEEARLFVRDVTSKGESTRIYAIGGDGTLCDVLAGVADFTHTEIGCFPCGTGNDFVKSLPTQANMLDMNIQRIASAISVDMLSVHYGDAAVRCLNIVNVGLDATAAYYMQKIKRIPLLGGLSYVLGLLGGVCRPLGLAVRAVLDGKEFFDGTATIAVFAGGQYYGGGFRAAPEANVADGWMDVCLVRKVSHMRFFRLVGMYKRGEHLRSPALADIILSGRAREIALTAPRMLRLCCDGEIFSVPAGETVRVKLEPQLVRFVVPG